MCFFCEIYALALHCRAGRASIRSNKMASMKDANFEVVFQEEFFFSMGKVLTKKIYWKTVIGDNINSSV